MSCGLVGMETHVGKTAKRNSSGYYGALIFYDAHGWKVLLFVNNAEPNGELVVLVKNDTYDHLKNNRLARVYMRDGGNSGSEEGSDAESGKDDGGESTAEETGDGGDKGKTADKKAEEMGGENDGDTASDSDGGDKEADAEQLTGGASQSTQEMAATNPKQPGTGGNEDASTEEASDNPTQPIHGITAVHPEHIIKNSIREVFI